MNQSDKIHWGILSTANIGRNVAKAIAASRTGALYAVASRDREKVNAFADACAIPVRYDSYEAMLEDPKVQAVYISLPNHLHAQWTIRAAEAGKHILCEKPFATHVGEAMAALQAVRDHDVFFMEAFMYRAHPQTRRILELIREGAIGEVRMIQAPFSYNLGHAPQNLRMRRDVAGGGIMDVGCYALSMARLIAGAALGREVAEPLALHGTAHINPQTGVDEWAMALLKFENDIQASLCVGTQVAVDPTLRIWGSQGNLQVPRPWFPIEGENVIHLQRQGEKDPQTITVSTSAPLYSYEVDILGEHLHQRQAPSPCMTWEDSLNNQRALDRWRKAVELTFDMDEPAGMTTTVAGRPLARRATAPMRYHRLEGLDKEISRIVMGTMIYNLKELPLTFAMLDHYFEQGGNTLDLAYVYGGGESEKAVGQWLATRKVREQMVLSDKGVHPPFLAPGHVASQITQSLERLGVEHLDLYALHRDDTQVPVGEWVDVLHEQAEAGRITLAGVSNWTLERLEEANVWAKAHGRRPLRFNSPNLSLACWNQPAFPGCMTIRDAASRAWHTQHAMPAFCWSSQAAGFFTGRLTPACAQAPDDYTRWTYATWYSDVNLGRLERARELAGKLGVTASDIALAWVLHQPFANFALIGPRTPWETNDALGAMKVELTDEQVAWLAMD